MPGMCTSDAAEGTAAHPTGGAAHEGMAAHLDAGVDAADQLGAGDTSRLRRQSPRRWLRYQLPILHKAPEPAMSGGAHCSSCWRHAQRAVATNGTATCFVGDTSSLALLLLPTAAAMACAQQITDADITAWPQLLRAEIILGGAAAATPERARRTQCRARQHSLRGGCLAAHLRPQDP